MPSHRGNLDVRGQVFGLELFVQSHGLALLPVGQQLLGTNQAGVGHRQLHIGGGLLRELARALAAAGVPIRPNEWAAARATGASESPRSFEKASTLLASRRLPKRTDHARLELVAHLRQRVPQRLGRLLVRRCVPERSGDVRGLLGRQQGGQGGDGLGRAHDSQPAAHVVLRGRERPPASASTRRFSSALRAAASLLRGDDRLVDRVQGRAVRAPVVGLERIECIVQCGGIRLGNGLAAATPAAPNASAIFVVSLFVIVKSPCRNHRVLRSPRALFGPRRQGDWLRRRSRTAAWPCPISGTAPARRR